MGVVYRYINTDTKTTEYIGIVYSKNRTLKQRVNEHSKEEKFKNKNWKIQYFYVKNRTECEYWESHLIAKYKTFNYLNVDKKNWGMSSYLPNDRKLWKNYNNTNYKKINNCYDIPLNNIYLLNKEYDIIKLYEDNEFTRIAKIIINDDSQITNIKIQELEDNKIVYSKDLFEYFEWYKRNFDKYYYDIHI